MKNRLYSNFTAAILCIGFSASLASAQENAVKFFGKGNPFTIEQLPAGELKTKLEQLDAPAREVALNRLHKISFQEFDAAKHLRVDNAGGIYTVCTGHKCDGHAHDDAAAEPQESILKDVTEKPVDGGSSNFSEPTVARAAVPITSPPAYNSKPNAPNHIYLDFNGGIVTGKQWNTGPGSSPSYNCLPWSRDGDLTTFSDSEQLTMFQTWQRMAEDFAPFNVNVTTDVRYDPANPISLADKRFVGWILHTPTQDKDGKSLPHEGAGGVAYLDVFGDPSYPSYQPAWTAIQDGQADTFAEVSSHEIGHNLGLNHDGRGASAYYLGHGAGDLSWAPIMGAGYGRNMTQWSKGDYSGANNTEDDDLAIIAAKFGIITSGGGYRSDDHGNISDSGATELVVTGTTIINSTTPQTDPTNSSPENKGIIEKASDVDVFWFETGDGVININVDPWVTANDTIGNNLDINIELYDDAGNLVVSSTPTTTASATISPDLVAGTYFLHIKNSAAGSPMNLDPSGYSAYGSLGQYFISGTIQEATPRLRVLSITPNEAENNLPVNVVITGRLFRTGPSATEVYLKRTGSSDIQGTITSVVGTDLMNVTFPITGAAIGLWDLYAVNPELDLVPLEEDTLVSAFNITLPIIEFFEEYFDGSTSLPSGWTTYTTTESAPLWTVDTTSFDTTPHSAGAITPSSPATKYLQSPPIQIDPAAINLQLSFWQSCKLESGYDGGVLEYSVKDLLADEVTEADWFDITTNESGAVFESNGYNKVISEDYRSPIAGRFAWSGDSKGYVQTLINLTNASKYSGKVLRFRWLLATDSSASSSNWNIDTVDLFGSYDPDYSATPVNDLVVTAATGLSFSGNYGGPFTPSSQTYTLTNNGTELVKWSAHKTSTWVSLSATSGSLTAGSSVELTVSINSNSLALPAGTFTDTISIRNLSFVEDVIDRVVTLEVDPIPTTVSITNRNHNYNGSPKSVTVTTDPADVPVIVTYNGNTTPPTNPGTYAVVATVDSDFHVGSATANMTIYPVPNLVRTTVNNVTSTGWTTVNFGKTYVSPVIVATPIYKTSSLPPVVTRIRNVTPTSFQLRIARADGLTTAVSMSVSVVAVNEGVYTVARQGVKMEAVKYTSTLTASGTGAWNAEARTYQNTYTNPVVVGQVMSYNSSRWSAFWSRGATATSPISSASLNVGKHVGMDSVKTRANETIGYIVIESGTGTINGVRYQAAVGSDIVRSFGDSATPYSYPLSGFASVSNAAVSQTGMDGTEGSWAVMSGSPALTTTALKLHVAEDGFSNTLRQHTTEQVAFIVFQ